MIHLKIIDLNKSNNKHGENKMEIQQEVKKTDKKDQYLIDKKEHKIRSKAFFNKYSEIAMKIQKLPFENKISWGSLLEERVLQYSDRPAVFFEDTVLTYKEFNEAVNRYANYFISIGLKKGDIVEILMKNRTEVLIIYTANAKIGAISSMINNQLRKKTLAYCINLTPGKFVVVGEGCCDQFNDIRPDLNLSEEQKLFFVPDQGDIPLPEGFEDLPNLVKDSPIDNPPTVADVHTMDPIAYIFTSGTTGLPKAAILLHFRTAVYGFYFGVFAAEFTPEDIIYICLPFFHGTALETGWSAVLATGGAVAVARKFSVSRFWDDIRKYKATAFSYVGELCRYLINQPPTPDDLDNSVKTVIGNGLRPEIWMEFKTRFDIPKIVEFYGASEGNAGFCNTLNFDYTVGSTIAQYAVVEYDIENDEPIRDERGRMKKVKLGETGLLLILSHGAYTFTGYTDKKASETKLYHNVLKEGDAYFNTGDLMRDIGCGHLQFVDRLGDTFRWKGHNVSTTEVEEVLNIHDDISLSCVYGIQIPLTDGRAGMAAIVSNVNVEEFDLQMLANTFRQNLADYAVPIFLRFKTELTVTPTFKFRKVELKKEGFDIFNIMDSLYVLLPGELEYQPLTNEIYENIQNQKYKF